LESIQERELGLVAERWPGRIELGVEMKAHDSGVRRQVGEGDDPNAPVFDTPQPTTRSAEHPGYVGLVQPRAQPGFAKVVTDGVEQPNDMA
jgi:hypothetical protein